LLIDSIGSQFSIPHKLKSQNKQLAKLTQISSRSFDPTMKFSSSALSSLAMVAFSVVVCPDMFGSRTGGGAVLVQACDGHPDHHHEDTRQLQPDEDEGFSRCDTPETTLEEDLEMEHAIEEWVAEQEQLESGSVRRGLASLKSIEKSPVKIIDTVFHIIDNTREDNLATEVGIEAQVQLMNEAFAPGKFQFNLIDITYTVNDFWFRPRGVNPMRYPEAYGLYLEEIGGALRVGDAETLNIYVNRAAGGGVSTIPAKYERFPNRDGFVLNHGTVPFTHLPGYELWNEGATAVHEVRTGKSDDFPFPQACS
jgi:hypothetical protein